MREILPTALIILVLVAAIVWAVVRLMRKGMCDCGGSCDRSSPDGCCGCAAANKMTESLEQLGLDAKKETE